MTDTVKIKNTSGEDRLVPWLGGRLVVKNAVVEVPPGDVFAYTCQEDNWAPHDKPAKDAHQAVLEQLDALLNPVDEQEG